MGKYVPGQNSGSSNCNWKGESVGYHSIHRWIERRLPKPSVCPRCDQNKKLELHNLDKKYSRDLSTWRWVCRKCHQDIEGITDKLKSGDWSRGHKLSETLKEEGRRRAKKWHQKNNHWGQWPSIHAHRCHYSIIKFLENRSDSKTEKLDPFNPSKSPRNPVRSRDNLEGARLLFYLFILGFSSLKVSDKHIFAWTTLIEVEDALEFMNNDTSVDPFYWYTFESIQHSRIDYQSQQQHQAAPAQS